MKILVYRLSSLGDLILSTAFLESLPEGVKVDWVIASEFSFVLKGHPKIDRLIVFDKSKGLKGWLALTRKLAQERYDYRVDLHRTLRTSVSFALFSILDRVRGRTTRTLQISKERGKTWALLTLKQWLPRTWVPTPYWKRFAELAASIQSPDTLNFGVIKTPSYLPILEKISSSISVLKKEYDLEGLKYFCVMPASRWPTKEWGTPQLVEVIQKLASDHLTPVILGREKDPACDHLRKCLIELKIPFRDALAEPDFHKTALLIQGADFYLGCDTGLSHLAESVGCKANIIFGPTRPELGFGPCQPSSRSISYSVFCSPCSKDGRNCYRVFSPYKCMSGLTSDQVLRNIKR